LAELTQHLDLHDASKPSRRHTARSSIERHRTARFYNFDPPGVDHSEAVVENWWRQGMMGGAKGHYECISGFIEEDHTAALEKITVPALAMNGEADQIVPCASSGPRVVELLKTAR
jgi:non-heme chloroperoxidase